MAGRVMQDEPTPGTPPAELPGDFADLAALAAQADAQIDGAGAMVAPGAEPAPEVDRGAEFGAMLQMAVQLGAPALPFLQQCYTPGTCQAIGTAFEAVAEKYGWNLDAINSPELALAMVAIPPTAMAYAMGRAHFAHKRAEAERQASAHGAPPLPPIEVSMEPAPAPTYSPGRIGG